MSQTHINDYLAELDRIKKVSGTTRESVVREAFKDLLKAGAASMTWCSCPSTSWTQSPIDKTWLAAKQRARHGHKVGTKAKHPLRSGRLLLAEAFEFLVARAGFEPATFGL